MRIINLALRSEHGEKWCPKVSLNTNVIRISCKSIFIKVMEETLCDNFLSLIASQKSNLEDEITGEKI
jgi:hypothetical protein